MPIDITFDAEHRTVALEASGRISGGDLVGAIAALYDRGTAERVRWDFARADLSGLLDAELRLLVDHPLHRRHGRPGCICAFVVSGESASHRLEPLVEAAARALLPFHVRVFTRCDEATKWLTRDDHAAFLVCCPYCRERTPRRGAHLVDALLVTCHRCACTFSLPKHAPSPASSGVHRRACADRSHGPQKRKPTPVP